MNSSAISDEESVHADNDGPAVPADALVEQTAASTIKVPRFPHMAAKTIAFLKSKLLVSKCYLEYGSGGSTRMAVRMNVPYVFSVESDPDYGRAVRHCVRRAAKDTKFRMYKANIGTTSDNWGRPDNDDAFRDWPKYPVGIWGAIREAEVTPDLILIDGRFRVACFLVSLLQAAPGTTILFDDYTGRKSQYAEVEKHLKPHDFADRAAIFCVPEDIDARSIALDLALNLNDFR